MPSKKALEEEVARLRSELAAVEAKAVVQIEDYTRRAQDDFAALIVDRDRLQAEFDAAYKGGWKGIVDEVTKERDAALAAPRPPVRRRLPDERDSVTRKFKLHDEDGHPVKGYMTVSFYEDGTTPGEIFLVIDKGGSTVRGLADALATVVSIALQYGVPLDVIASKMVATKFSPAGFTGEGADGIENASSVLDYSFRRIPKIVEGKVLKSAGKVLAELVAATPSPSVQSKTEIDAPTCVDCGTVMTRAGACFKCGNCGSSSGCG